MNIKRFFGKNTREALNMVRKALGEDAVIISNKTVDGGTEIMAVSEAEMQSMANDNTPVAPTMPAAAPKPTASAQAETMQQPAEQDTGAALHFDAQEAFEDAPSLLTHLTQQKGKGKINAAFAEADTSTSAHESEPNLFSNQASDPNEDLNKKLNMMMLEMRSLRNKMETQFSALSWDKQLQADPIKSKIINLLLGANFSAAMARQLAEKLPDNLDINGAQAWVKNILSRNLHTIQDESELFDKGGVFALVGPTGVGKTTTTAKLAARYVMKHGTQNLGLITTDGYRVGGHEQLRIYGKILGVMVYAVKDEADLKIALNELKHKHTILVDTIGVSQRDQMVTQQIAMLRNAQVDIKKLLCLNATNTGETLTDVVKAYKGRALDGCIITKVDEAASVGNALDVVIREKIKLYYTTNGQRVPEDINLANSEMLVADALSSKKPDWPYQHQEQELPFVLANATEGVPNV